MSRFLGPTRQLGFVVPDIEEAMRHWSDVMGVGPFFYNPQVPIEDYTYDASATRRIIRSRWPIPAISRSS